MSDDIKPGESETPDIKDGEQKPNQDEEAKKEAEREIVRKAEMDKVPDWVKDEILKKSQEELKASEDKRFEERFDKRDFDQKLPTVLEKLELSDEQTTAFKDRVDSLVANNNHTHKDALHLATLEYESSGEAGQVSAGSLPPESTSSQASLRLVSNSDFDLLSPDQKKDYMQKTKEQYGEVKFK